MKYPDGVACDHPGCLRHISHPCEGCGRIGGRPAPLFDTCVCGHIRQRHDVTKEVGVHDGGCRAFTHVDGKREACPCEAFAKPADFIQGNGRASDLSLDGLLADGDYGGYIAPTYGGITRSAYTTPGLNYAPPFNAHPDDVLAECLEAYAKMKEALEDPAVTLWRARILASWEKYGTVEPLDPRTVEHLAKEFAKPLEWPKIDIREKSWDDAFYRSPLMPISAGPRVPFKTRDEVQMDEESKQRRKEEEENG